MNLLNLLIRNAKLNVFCGWDLARKIKVFLEHSCINHIPPNTPNTDRSKGALWLGIRQCPCPPASKLNLWAHVSLWVRPIATKNQHGQKKHRIWRKKINDRTSLTLNWLISSLLCARGAKLQSALPGDIIKHTDIRWLVTYPDQGGKVGVFSLKMCPWT